jgi:phosphoglycolate phosphatase-like HAD superfamily hydrolase
MLSAIVFDFDGVILESAELKTQAFITLFSRIPGPTGKIVDYLKENPGLSRYTKFHHIYENFLRLPLSPEEMMSLDREFSQLVADEIRRCPFVHGVIPFIEERSRELPLFIVSATPERELVSIARERGLHQFFKGIYGSPPSKISLLRSIHEELRQPPESLLLIGDTLHDYRAATEIGTRFIGRTGGTNASPFASYSVVTVKDFVHLQSIWPLPA